MQEAPRLLLWRTSRALLAHRSGLRVATRRWAAGNLLLTGPRVTVRSSGVVALPRHPGLHRRAAAVAEVEVAGRRLHVAGTHLDLDPAARLDSARRVRAALPPGPVVLGADVNDEPGTGPWQALGEGLTDARAGLRPTFPARAPHRSIDVVLTTLAVLTCEVVDTGAASDHLALLALLRLP